MNVYFLSIRPNGRERSQRVDDSTSNQQDIHQCHRALLEHVRRNLPLRVQQCHQIGFLHEAHVHERPRIFVNRVRV